MEITQEQQKLYNLKKAEKILDDEKIESKSLKAKIKTYELDKNNR